MKKGLSGRQLSDYVAFMRERFPKENPNVNESFSYSTEWAERFAKGTEFDMADTRSRKALIKANPKKYTAFDELPQKEKNKIIDEFRKSGMRYD